VVGDQLIEEDPNVPKGYVIITEDIHDPEGMEAYGKMAASSIGEHRPTPLVVDENVEVLEGEWPGNRTIILEFESVEQAHEWYESAGYQAALPLRQAAANCNAVMVSGFAPPPAQTAAT
jgi:uncharacterized protein (DUF1330 family)